MTLRRRIMQLEGRTTARIVSDAVERLKAYLDRIAARMPMPAAPPKAKVAEIQAELEAILQRLKP